MTNISIKQTTPHISIRASGKQGPKGDPGTTDYNELENLPDLTLKADKATTYTKTEVDTALDAKATTAALDAHANSTTNPHQVTKAQVGLGNVDNTADADKPVSTATQTALDGKVSNDTLIIEVTQHGATGDGTTDDVEALRAIFLGGNKRIYFPEGIYRVTKYIRVQKNTDVVLHPNATILNDLSDGTYGSVFLNGVYGDVTYASGYSGDGNIHIRGGTIDCTPLTSRLGIGQAIAFAHASNIVIENVRFYNNFQNHFIEVNGCSMVRIRDCIFDTTLGATGTREAINVDYSFNAGFPHFGGWDNTVCDDVIVDGCEFISCDVGVGSHSSSASYAHNNIVVSNNQFTNTVTSTITALNWKNSSFTNNYCDTTGSHAIDLRGAKDMLIIGNHIKNAANHGVYLETRNTLVPSNIIVSNNTIHDCTNLSIKIVTGTNILFSNNRVYNIGDEGVFVGTAASYITISNNRISDTNTISASGTKPAITLRSANSSAIGNVVRRGSSIYSYAIDMSISSNSGIECVGNIIEAGSVGTVALPTAAGVVTRINNHYYVLMNDDTAVAIPHPAPTRQGVVILSGNTSLTALPKGIIFVRCDASPYTEVIAVNTSPTNTYTTGVLSGSTGTDGNFTVSSASDGKLYIENRTGTQRRMVLEICG